MGMANPTKNRSAMSSRNQVNKSLTTFIFKCSNNTEDDQLERKGTFLVSCICKLFYKCSFMNGHSELNVFFRFQHQGW